MNRMFRCRAATAGKAPKAGVLPRLLLYETTGKNIWGRILGLACFKFAVAALRFI